MSGHSDLQPQLYLQSDFLMCRFKSINELINMFVEEGASPPYIFTNLKNCDAVFFILRKGGFDQYPAAIGCAKKCPMFAAFLAYILIYNGVLALPLRGRALISVSFDLVGYEM